MHTYLKPWLTLMMTGIVVAMLPSTTYASDEKGTTQKLPKEENVPPNHQWSIFFNTKLKKSSVSQENIQVLDRDGGQVPVGLHVTGKHLTITPPKNGYQQGEGYKLVLKRDIQSTKGLDLLTKVVMEFDIASNYTPLTIDEIETSSKEKLFYINGVHQNKDLFSHNQVTYFPLKPLIEGMGDEYIHNDRYGTIQLNNGDISYRVLAGRNVVYNNENQAIPITTEMQNGEKKPGSYRILEVEGQIYVPLRMVTGLLNYTFKTKRIEGITQYHFGEKTDIVQKDKSERSYNNPLDVPLLNQLSKPQLYNGCEVTSLAMILLDHGIEVTKNELAQSVAEVPLNYENGLKGNPNQGFVGDMKNGPGLSVYHGPMMDLSKKYVGDRVVDLTGGSSNELYKYIDEGLPVWVITTTSLAPVNNFHSWNTPQGQINVTFSVHSVVLTGYTNDYVYVNDPYGQKNKKVDRQQFERAWKQMGKQAIVVKRESN